MKKLTIATMWPAIILLKILTLSSLFAQAPINFCGTESTANFMSYYNQLRSTAVYTPQSTTQNLIPLHFWIIQDDAGTNFATPTITQIDDLITQANPYFNFPGGEKFVRCGVSFVKKTAYTVINTQNQLSINRDYYNCNALNIYVVQNPGFGYAFATFPTNQAVATGSSINNMVALNSSIVLFPTGGNVQVFAHELGHAFGLLHTFEGSSDFIFQGQTFNNREQVSRDLANCEGKGDRLCDTPADYGINGSFAPLILRGSCFPNSNCVGGSCATKDDAGVFLTPDFKNIMSYFDYSCQDHFSVSQQSVMNAALYTSPSRTFLLRSVQGVIETQCNIPNVAPLLNAKVNMSVAYNTGTVLTNVITCQPYSTSTNTIGNFNTCALNSGFTSTTNPSLNYQQIATASPEKNTDYRNGVTTFDISLIQQHILDILPLSNSYKKVAADVDNSGEIDAADMLYIRNLILARTNTFPFGVGSWRFVPKFHLSNGGFASSFNTNPFTASYSNGSQTFTYLGTNSYMNKISHNLSNSNANTSSIWSFDAVKMGDVNCNSSASTARMAQPQHTYSNSNNKTISLKTGEEKTVLVNATYNGSINNWQVGFKFATTKVTVTSVEKGDFNTANDVNDYSLQNGELRALWFSDKGKTKDLKNGKTLIKLKIKALTNVTDLLTELQLDPSTLLSEFYDNSMLQVGVALTLEASGSSTAIDNSAYTVKVFPNPFTNDLTFEVTSPVRENNALLTISNTLGLPIHTVRQNLEIGTNTIRIANTSTFPIGLLSYSIKLSTTTLTGTVSKSR